MKKLMFLFSVAFMLISSFAFANNREVINSINKIENQKLKYSFNLGDVTNLTEIEINSICDKLNDSIIPNNIVGECTITYSGTVNIAGSSITVTVSATAATCELAGAEARRGLRNEINAVKKELTPSNAGGGGGGGGW